MIVLFVAIKYLMLQNNGSIVEIKKDNVILATLPLSEDTDYTIIDDAGDINVLIIKDNMAYIDTANCPNKDCIKQGKISYIGESIICIPHKVVITIK